MDLSILLFSILFFFSLFNFILVLYLLYIINNQSIKISLLESFKNNYEDPYTSPLAFLNLSWESRLTKIHSLFKEAFKED